MKLWVGRELLDLEDKPLKMTLRVAMYTACKEPLKGDEALSLEQKMKIFELATILCKDEEVIELKAEQLALVKDRINRGYPSAIMVGVCCLMLEDGEMPRPHPELVVDNEKSA